MAEDAASTLALRRALGAFPTGVTVAAVRGQAGVPIGITVNSFTSVSLEPPLVLVCIGLRSASGAVFAAAPSFGVSVLRDTQTSIAARFARSGPDRFAGVPHRQAVTGAPILDDCLAWFDCRLQQRIEAGDHVIMVGRVAAFGSDEGLPLGYFRGSFAGVQLPGKDA